MRVEWDGAGTDEKGCDAQGNVIVAVDPRYFRPAEVSTLLGDPSKARRELGWKPRTSFMEMMEEMVREDLKIAKRDALVKDNGYSVFNQFE
jgi:GDPmannose 4,6-dehydratase